MNPGFVNKSDELIVDGTLSGLDGRLKEIMTKYMPADYRGETKAAVGDGGYVALTTFVAIGRFALEPLTG